MGACWGEPLENREASAKTLKQGQPGGQRSTAYHLASLSLLISIVIPSSVLEFQFGSMGQPGYSSGANSSRIQTLTL